MSEHRVEGVLHEAIAELALLGEVYLANFAERMSPGLGRGPLEVLIRLRGTGPVPVSTLPRYLRLDTETVARHVAELERHGLVVRRGGADPVVAVAEAAVELLELAESERRGRMLDAVIDWPPHERLAFARMLSRFVDRDDLAVRVSEMTEALPDRRPIW